MSGERVCEMLKRWVWLIEITVVFGIGFFCGRNESIFHMTKTHFAPFEGHWYDNLQTQRAKAEKMVEVLKEFIEIHDVPEHPHSCFRGACMICKAKAALEEGR